MHGPFKVCAHAESSSTGGVDASTTALNLTGRREDARRTEINAKEPEAAWGQDPTHTAIRHVHEPLGRYTRAITGRLGGVEVAATCVDHRCELSRGDTIAVEVEATAVARDREVDALTGEGASIAIAAIDVARTHRCAVGVVDWAATDGDPIGVRAATFGCAASIAVAIVVGVAPARDRGALVDRSVAIFIAPVADIRGLGFDAA